jgi:hypothetical protein
MHLAARHAVLVLAIGTFGGCAHVLAAPDGPPMLRQGWHDGCDTGYHDGGSLVARTTIAWPLYDADPLYRKGWTDGRKICFSWASGLDADAVVLRDPVRP